MGRLPAASKPTLDVSHIERWLIGHSYELGAHNIDIAELRTRAATYGTALRDAGQRTLASWLDQLEL